LFWDGGNGGFGYDGFGVYDTFWDKFGEVVLDVAANSPVEVDVISFLTIDAALFNDAYLRKNVAAEPQ